MVVTNYHRCSMAPVFDSQRTIVTSRKGSEEFIQQSSDEFLPWQILENSCRPKMLFYVNNRAVLSVQ